MGFEKSGRKRSAVAAGLLRYPRATLRSGDVDFAHLAGRNRMTLRHRECRICVFAIGLPMEGG